MTEALLYYEDLEPGASLVSPAHTIARDELVAFAQCWDPLPFHVDEAAGVAAFGSLTAPGLYMLAIKQRLVHRLPPLAVIASMGYDEVRFLAPLRPGDTVVLKAEWMERRPSASKPDRGIVKIRFTLLAQDGAAVLSHLDTVLVRRRAGSS
jgi:acyl dehydratase